MKFVWVYLVLLAGFAGVFAIGRRLRKHDLIDIFWGMGFVVSGLTAWVLGMRSAIGTLMLVLVTLWGLRLTVHLARRNLNQPEDFRYRAMREKWPKNFERIMFLRIYLLQFALNALIGFPLVYTNIAGAGPADLFTWLGLAVWLFGFGFEVIGDAQLRRFKADANNKGRLMTAGLWSLTRHPNYFGEAVLWWGLWLISLSRQTGRWLLVFSPVIITLLVRYVSGVPMLEKKYQGRPDWEEYKRRTSVFIPRPPRKG